MFESGTLVIFNETKNGFEFQMDAYSGGHMGFIDGTAVINGSEALYKDTGDDGDYPPGAEITFILKDGMIALAANEAANGHAGSGVYFGGQYTKNALPKATLLTQGYVSNEAEDDAFRAMVGDDYELFLNTAHLGYEEEDLDGYDARVYRWSVRGLAGYFESIVMFLPDGQLCAAVLDPDNNTFIVYTDAGNMDSVPRTVLAWIADIQEMLGLTADMPVEFYNTEKINKFCDK